MSYSTNFSLSSSAQIETALCRRLEQIRLSRNITQAQLAEEAGVSTRTVRRLEKGEGVSLDTFIRVMMALRIQHHLEGFLPDPSVRPVERAGLQARERRRARPTATDVDSSVWTWGDEESEDDK